MVQFRCLFLIRISKLHWSQLRFLSSLRHRKQQVRSLLSDSPAISLILRSLVVNMILLCNTGKEVRNTKIMEREHYCMLYVLYLCIIYHIIHIRSFCLQTERFTNKDTFLYGSTSYHSYILCMTSSNVFVGAIFITET